MTEQERMEQRRITMEGNPSKPRGEAGMQMLERMNQSHSAVTNWALDFLSFRPGFRDHGIVSLAGVNSAFSPSQRWESGVRYRPINQARGVL